ncbi:hypothetical protein CYLTODRAFT_435620 [Cylindrobasidium torrendii FP15055 ss-10]|uniref:CUE domain-containing protein n=1 Tax=Cylindrobasidium torrendii FP15055 ss-10 TaxID=1314674 RepID=A0A0D7BJH2_9AGAR|nr:hypothetical protein CYLTODRAFT_435620 [Cylindrobasidium torrendii FP15055 ss-10]
MAILDPDTDAPPAPSDHMPASIHPILSPTTQAATTTPLPTSPSAASPTPHPVPTQETPVNPHVAELRAMFPDFDDALLQSVLDSVNGNQDRAIDVLLGMSDPNFKSDTAQAPLPPAQPVLTQEELDEQFARRLLLEDEQREHYAWQQQSWNNERQPVIGNIRRDGQPPEKDAMTELGEQFNKFAETGKRTFGNIFNKVKAKMAEFDQPQQQNAGQSAGASSSQQQQQAWPQPGPQSAQPSFYDPNSSPALPSTPQPASTFDNSARGYDVEPAMPPRPPSTGPGQPIDGGKLGLLPKRPVSLLRTSSPDQITLNPGNSGASKPAQRRLSNDSDELDYAENPFEDSPSRK